LSLILYFLRHGQTVSSRDNLFCGSGSDTELTDAGHEMARSFADAYRTIPWNAVYSSPLTRAATTARPLCEALGIKIEVRDGLKEISYGQWEGQSAETVSRDFHDDHIRWTADPAWYAPTGGEPAIAIARRALEVIEEIRQRHRSGNVLVVSHKATIRIALCSLLGIDVGRFRYRLGCPVGSVSKVEFGLQGPLLHTLADRTHLSAKLRALPGT
jgi:probable phosphoglycerate mutase